MDKKGNYLYSWLRKRRKEDMIRTLDKGTWQLTDKGVRIKNILNRLNLSESNLYSSQSIF
jgi:hypothetical protein